MSTSSEASFDEACCAWVEILATSGDSFELARDLRRPGSAISLVSQLFRKAWAVTETVLSQSQTGNEHSVLPYPACARDSRLIACFSRRLFSHVVRAVPADRPGDQETPGEVPGSVHHEGRHRLPPAAGCGGGGGLRPDIQSVQVSHAAQQHGLPYAMHTIPSISERCHSRRLLLRRELTAHFVIFGQVVAYRSSSRLS